MRQMPFALSVLSLVAMLPMAAGGAKATESATADYARAIHAVIQQHWEAYSYGSEMAPGASCPVRILQQPGGMVAGVEPLPDCSFDEAGRRSVAEAVRKAAPLPYEGFEAVFQPEIRMTFQAASIEERQLRASFLAETERNRRDSAEADRQWEATVGARRKREQYARQCAFHLLWEMPRIQLERPVSVIVTVDRSGKIVGVTGPGKEVVDDAVVEALKAKPPCAPIAADVAGDEGTIEIGPISIGNQDR